MDRGFTCPVGRLRRREEEAAEGEQEGEEREEEGGEARGGGDRERWGPVFCASTEFPRRNWIRFHCQGYLRVEGRVESWGNSGSAPF